MSFSESYEPQRTLDPYMVGFRAFFLGKEFEKNPFTGRGKGMMESRGLWSQGWREAKAHPDDGALVGVQLQTPVQR